MVKYVDIKQGAFQIYQGNTLDFIEGILTNIFELKGAVKQLQYVIEGEFTYKLNIYTNTSHLLDMSKILLNYKRGEKIKIALVKNGEYANLVSI